MRSIFFCLFLLIGFSGCQKKVTQEELLPDYLKALLPEWDKAGASVDMDDFLRVKAYPSTDLDSLINANKEIIVELQAGEYFLDEPLNLKTDVFLKGIHKDSVFIISTFKRPFHPMPLETPCSIEFWNANNSGLSNLTLIYRAVDFLPHHQEYFHEGWDKQVFKNDPQGDTLLYVGHVGIKNSEQITIDNCNIYNAGTDPIIIAESSHVSILDTHVKGSYNKGGKGNGYFNIDANSSYVLLKGNRVEKIRHLAIQNGAHHNVVVENDLEVDVNFHNGDAGSNLVERNIIRIPEWHGWHCFSAGAKSLHDPPGSNNYLFNNLTQYKLPIPVIRPIAVEYGDSIIYQSQQIVDTIMIKDQPQIRYKYGAVDFKRSTLSNRLFVMNDQWNDRKRVQFLEELEVQSIYLK
ncbi:MAG: right-handed parallel beta-helix repeat-containing protein [Bacteroidota bacterium]